MRPNRKTDRTAPPAGTAHPTTRPEPTPPAPARDDADGVSEYDNGVSRNADRYPRNAGR